MDWATIFQDAGIVAAAATAIFFVIDFIKKLYYKLPWAWVEKTPGEIWFLLSMLLGIGVAIVVFWDSFFGESATMSSGIASASYGLVSGAGSKFINAVASSAGAKLKASKEESEVKTRVLEKSDVLMGEETTIWQPPQEPIPAETKTDSLVEIVKIVKPEGDYVIIDGTVHKLTKENNE